MGACDMCLATGVGKYGIRGNSVMPGTIATDINRDDLADPAERAYMEKRIPLGRPEAIAKAVADGGLFVNLQ